MLARVKQTLNTINPYFSARIDIQFKGSSMLHFRSGLICMSAFATLFGEIIATLYCM